MLRKFSLVAALLFLLESFSFDVSRSTRPRTTLFLHPLASEDFSSDNSIPSIDRRNTLLAIGLGSSMLSGVPSANAAFFRRGQKSASLYVVSPDANSTDSLQKAPVKVETDVLSSESCLLRLLPVKNKFFRQLQATIEGVNAIRVAPNDTKTWELVTNQILFAVSEIDKKRFQLEPVFNPEDNSMLQITKGERGEQLIEQLRTRLVELSGATKLRNETATYAIQKDALLALSAVGELLVSSFPYDVPTEGKYSYLPRLLGRTRVTFSFKRGKKVLGNVTIIADGFTAPITAGNFVDLSIRNFYTGLPVKFAKKRLGTGNEFEVANIPVLGSFQEGFYDPLTAKPRRIPLEIIRIEKGSTVPILSYDQGLSSLTGSAVFEPSYVSKPLLSFDIPGLIAMNHPDKSPNGGSSEFFGLQRTSLLDEKRKLFDGDYAPFGYIVDGYEIFQDLQPNDIIDGTFVDEWGQLNLVKLRQSSFSEVVQGSSD